MEDHEDINGSTTDLEAQRSSPLLMNNELSNTSCLMRRSVLFLRSTHKFIEAGARSLSRVSSASSTTTFYTPLNSFDLQPGGDHEIHIDKIVAASSPDGVDRRVNTVHSNNNHVEIELQHHAHESHQQCLQITKISEIVKEKNLDSLHNFGGVKGVAEALSSDADVGIHVGDISHRHKATNLSLHMIFTGYGNFFRQLACKEPTILLLVVAAILSFAFGINEEGVQNGWFEGAILVVIIFVTVSFKLAQTWYKRRCWKKLKDHKANVIQVIRGGNEVEISALDLVYGDIACLRQGHSIPAHGLFVSGEALELFQLHDGLVSIANEQSPFLSPGSKVINGDARMIVTSIQVDKASQKSKIIVTDSSFCTNFDKLNKYVHISGLLNGILIIVVVFIRFKFGHKDDENGYRLETKGESAELAMIMNAVKKVLTESKGTLRVWITLLSVSAVGITEGTPYLISVAMAYWNSNFDVKKESVSTLCIENASWLKEQKLEVTQFFLDKKDVTKIPPHVCSVLSDGIRIGVSIQTAYHRIEEPILCWAEKNMERDTLDQQFTIVKDNDNETNPFEEPCGVVIEKTGDNGKEYYSHFKGPTDSILSMCSSYYDEEGEVLDLDDKTKRDFAQVNNNVNVVAFACKRTQVAELDENDLIFIGMFVLKDTTHINLDNMRQAIATLKEGGVKTIFSSEEDVEVLRTIGNDTGLLNSHDALVVRGEDFYNFTADDMKEKVEKVCIMGNSSTAHKLLFIEWLKKRGKVVAVVGKQAAESNLVLEAANFGLPVGTIWPETITRAINCIKGGRIACENLRQFIQLEVILAITSLSINFIMVILNGDAPLTAIQLVWIHLFVTFIGGPALLITQQSTRKLRDELSIRPRNHLITKAMWRNILFQASYQTGIFVFLLYRGSVILDITPIVNKSTVFNGFALCQLFNIFSARELEQKNFFKGLGQNYWFWALSGLFIGLQLGFIEVEPFFSSTARLNWKQWAESILIGAVTWLLDVIVKWASQYIKIDKCDCGVRINCCYSGPTSTPNSTRSLDSPLMERAGYIVDNKHITSCQTNQA